MTNLISYPFRITGTGAVASRDDDDEDYLAEELAQLIQTLPGERELVPTYGINDPAYTEFDKAMLIAQVSTFGPPVVIQAVEARFLSDAQQDIVVKFTPALTAEGIDLVGADIGSSVDSVDLIEEFTS